MLRVAIDLVLETTKLAGRCEHGDDFEPEPRGLSEVGDRIHVDWLASFVDTASEVHSGTSLVFQRHWEELSLVLERKGVMVGPPRVCLESPLKGSEVRYRWNPELGDYDKSVEEGADVPAGVTGTVGTLLPWMPVVDGRIGEVPKWKVEPQDFVRSLWPGGFQRLGYGERGSGMENWPGVHIAIVPELPPAPEVWMEGVAGKIAASLADGGLTRDPDHASVRLAVDIGGELAPEKWLRESLESAGITGEYAGLLGHSGKGLRWEWKAEGELIWSRQTGSWQDVHLDGELRVDYGLEWSYAWETPKAEQLFFEFLQVWRGAMSVRGCSEDPDASRPCAATDR